MQPVGEAIRVSLIAGALMFSSTLAAQSAVCEDAVTTLEINQCMSGIQARAEQRMQHYLQASLTHYQDDPETAEAIQKSQQAWQLFHDAQCDAIYTSWRQGTIRNAMYLDCSIDLIEQRTQALWRAWLTFLDGSEPLLPEPIPER